MSDNEPKNPKLWEDILDLARGKSNKPVSANGETVSPVNDGKGFQTWPSAYGVGWALAQYKRLGGKWSKAKKSYSMPRKWDEDHCKSKTCDEMGFSEKASCRPYKNCYEKSASSIPKAVRDTVLSGRRYDFNPGGKGKPSSNGMKLSIQGKSVEDIFKVYEILGDYLHSNQIEYKLATIKRINVSGPQSHKIMTIYIPDDVDDWREIAEDVSLLLHKHSYKGWHDIKTPPSYEHYSNAVFFRNDRDDYGGYIPAGKSAKRVAQIYLESAKRVDPKMKNTGHGGLDTWFSGHGGGKPDERATWGDWIAITPVKHTIKKEDGEDKIYEPGDIVGPCAVSSEADWKSVTSDGKKPLKCMPREKAYGMSKAERAELAKNKRRQENKHRGQKPVNTPTFSDEAKEIKDKAKKKADFYRQVSAPDSLSSYSNGTPVNRHEDNKAESSSLPNGDTARNIGRPSPDSPNLKYRNLDRSESYGRTPANKEDFGYVHDSGSGSARVIPYDSGYTNNSSALRVARRYLSDDK